MSDAFENYETRTNPYTYTTPHPQSEFLIVRELWLAAYVMANGCELDRILPIGPRRHHFRFRNDDDLAYRLLNQWRTPNAATPVDARTLRDCYKELVNLARDVTLDNYDKDDKDAYYDPGYGRSVATE